MHAAIYYPVLRCKPGEMKALEHLSPSTSARMRPIFEPLRPSPTDRVEVLQTTAMQLILRSWGRKLPFYVDLRRYDPKRLTATQGQPIDHLFQCADQLRLPALPVVGALGTRRAEYFNAVRRIGGVRKGAALRLILDDFASAGETAKIVETTLEGLELEAKHVELILDFGSRSRTRQIAKTDKQLLAIVEAAVRAVENVGLRSIVVCGTSVPERVGSEFNAEPSQTNRIEVEIWDKIAALTRQPLRFGDYGVVTPHQPDRGASSQPPSRVRLATRSEILSFRKKPARDSYQRLCSSVISDEAFGSQVASWGRSMIATSAVVRTTMESSDMVAHDTNMHLETTRTLVEMRLQLRESYTTLKFAEAERIPQQSDAFV